MTALNNPCCRDRRIDCLKHFVVVLTDYGQLKQLCELTFSGMEQEVRGAWSENGCGLKVVILV